MRKAPRPVPDRWTDRGRSLLLLACREGALRGLSRGIGRTLGHKIQKSTAPRPTGQQERDKPDRATCAQCRRTDGEPPGLGDAALRGGLSPSIHSTCLSALVQDRWKRGIIPPLHE